MTPAGHHTILIKLKRLKVLVRGGFLCEALEHISQHVVQPSWPRLEIEEFWSSEEYFFHDEQQMGLVQQMCPKMRKMMFQFSREVMLDVLFLVNFQNLSELHLWVKLTNEVIVDDKWILGRRILLGQDQSGPDTDWLEVEDLVPDSLRRD